jgi:hypothetical protein
MAGEPRFDLGMLVSPVVVGDQVQFEVARDVSIEMFQKAQEFLVTMARLALGDDPAVDDVQCREERGSAVAKVIVSYPLDITEPRFDGGTRSLPTPARCGFGVRFGRPELLRLSPSLWKAEYRQTIEILN